MTDLQRAYSGLSDRDREQIMIGFNSGTSQLIELGSGYFLAVHFVPQGNVTIIEEQNHFTYGRREE